MIARFLARFRRKQQPTPTHPSVGLIRTERNIDPIDAPPDGVYVHDGVYVTGTGQRLTAVHKPSKCVGDHCVIHRPSDHNMRSWPTHWRDDRGLMERICPHGVGHPDPDDTNLDHVHGCDGCCFDPIAFGTDAALRVLLEDEARAQRRADAEDVLRRAGFEGDAA